MYLCLPLLAVFIWVVEIALPRDVKLENCDLKLYGPRKDFVKRSERKSYQFEIGKTNFLKKDPFNVKFGEVDVKSRFESIELLKKKLVFTVFLDKKCY